VKVARLLGAGRIIATGHDDDQLREVLTLGADAVINIAVPDEALAQAYLDAMGDGYDVVLDYSGADPPRSCCDRWSRSHSRSGSRPG
jgi:threonine dehydrogenase-like Zn-dependent dehydrogenase